MSLSAIVDGRECNAALLSEAEWQTLRENSARVVVLSCCGTRGVPGTTDGSRFFRHQDPGICAWASRASASNLRIRSLIAVTAQDAGWSVRTEVGTGGWTSDVLAVGQKGQRVAFEVWLRRGPQPTDVERSLEACEREGIDRIVWFCRFPRRVGGTSLVRVCDIVGPPDGRHKRYGISVGGSSPIPLEEFVRRDLARELVSVPQLRPQHAIVTMWSWVTRCWKCQRRMRVVDASCTVASRCGIEMEALGMDNPELGEAVARYVATVGTPTLADVHLEFRSSATVGSGYWANVCPLCNTMTGAWFATDERLAVLSDANNEATVHTQDVPPSEAEEQRLCQTVPPVNVGSHFCLADPPCP